MEHKLDETSALSQMINWDNVDGSLTDEITQDEPTVEVGTEEQDGVQKSTPEATTETETKPEKVETPTVNEDEIRSRIEQELRESLTKEISQQSPKFANETIKKLNDLALAGVDTDSESFWAWQSRDLDKYDLSNKSHSLEVARLALELDNPEIPKTKIDRMLKKQYPALFDESVDSDDDSYKEAMEDLEIDAIRSLKKLKEHKQKVTLPSVDIKSQEEAKEQARKANESFVMEAKKTVNSYKEQPHKLTDDLEIKFQISNEAKKFAESAIVNNQTFFLDNYTEKDDKGNVTKVDFPRLTRDMTRLAQFDDFIKAAFEQGVSVGREGIVDTLENAGTKASSKKNETFKTYEEQIAEQLQNQFKRR
jgi:hypothetical protein